MNSVEELREYLALALGNEPSEKAFIHVDLVDVFNRKVLKDKIVLVGKGKIVAILEPGAEYSAQEVIDCTGLVMIPGLMDAHVHIESTMLTPERFAEAVVACGTTRVIADPHEIANVGGKLALEYMLSASEDLPVHIHFALPSCVPCTPFEDAGAVLDAQSLESFWSHPRVCSLGEMMNYPGVLGGDSDVLAKLCAAKKAHKGIDGHFPGLGGRQLQAYAGCGINNDHEETALSSVLAHVQAGMYAFVREGSAARDLDKVLGAVNANNAQRFCFCTDDLHAGDILAKGHINAILARAVAKGLPAPTAVAMASFNTSQCFNLGRVGAIAPGWDADLVLVEDLESFKVKQVYSAGQKVAEDGKCLVEINPRPVPLELLKSVRLPKLELSSFALPIPSGKARVICMEPASLMTKSQIQSVQCDANGCFDASLNPGLCKLAVLERHKALGLVGLGILAGYAKPNILLGGAIATSIAHDSHNIVVAGSSDQEMLLAVHTVAALGGGIALVSEGQVVASLALGVGGLMSQSSASSVAKAMDTIHDLTQFFAVSEGIDPIVSLSFMSLCVIPELKLNTRGLFDVTSFSFVPVDAGKEA